MTVYESDGERILTRLASSQLVLNQEIEHSQSSESVFCSDFYKSSLDLGNIALLATKISHELAVDEPISRQHHLMGVDIEGIQHRMWVTEPRTETEKPLTIVAKPGWCELIENGVGWEFHKQIAMRLPSAKVISHATQGVGPSAKRAAITDLPKLGINHMAKHGLKMLETFCPSERIVYVGTSMGTVIGNKLLNYNLRLGRPVDFAGVIYYAPAVVPPHNVQRDMLLRFFPSTIKDSFQEVVSRTRPQHIIKTLGTLAASRPSWRDIPPILRQGIDLLQGTPQDEIENVVESYNMHVITGQDDPVGQQKMWEEYAQLYSNLKFTKVRGAHGIALEPVDGGRKIAKTIQAMNL